MNKELEILEAQIEAILFTMGESVELGKIAEAIELEKKQTKEILEEMMEEWNNSDRGISIIELDGAYQMCTKPEMYEYLIRIAKRPKRRVLTDVLLETLSIVAYSQPITRAEIEAIRGVSADNMIRLLIERNLIKEVGKKDIPGKPVQFGTTKEFLKFFRLNSIADLPKLEETEIERFELAR